MNNGIYDNISITDYHANKTHVSATGIKRAKKSLKYFHWAQTAEQETKLHLDFGNAFELALLDPKSFEECVAIEQTEAWEHEALLEKPDLKRPKQSKKYQTRAEEFYKNNSSRYIIPDIGEKESFMQIEEMLKSCYQDQVIQKLISGTEYQLSLFWTHEEVDALDRPVLQHHAHGGGLREAVLLPAPRSLPGAGGGRVQAGARALRVPPTAGDLLGRRAHPDGGHAHGASGARGRPDH